MERRLNKKILIALSIFILCMSIGYAAMGQKLSIKAKGSLNSLGDFVYEYVSSTQSVKITNYIGKNTSVIIPTELSNYPVKTINSYAFDKKNLESISIPEGVESILFNAFSNNRLSQVIIPESVASIGSLAFDNNDITILSFKGDEAPTFGQNVFYRNSHLSNICIPSTADEASWRSALTSAGVSESVKIIKGRNGACSDIGTGEVGDIDKLSCGKNAYQDDDVCVCYDQYEGDPYSVCSISLDLSCYEFKLNGEFNSVTSYNCTNTSVIMPNYVDGLFTGSIASKAFSSKGIVSLELNDSLTTIGSNAFEYNGLKSVTIPENVTSIGSNAFTGNKLKTVIFEGDDVPSFGTGAFSSNSITRVCVPIGKTNEYKQALTAIGLSEDVNYFEDSSKCIVNDHSFSEGDITYTCEKKRWQGNKDITFQFDCTVKNETDYELDNWLIEWEVPSDTKIQNGWPIRSSMVDNIITIKNPTSEILSPGATTEFHIIVTSSKEIDFNEDTSSGGTNEEQILTQDAIVDGVSATFTVQNHWGNNYICEVVITNNSGIPFWNWLIDIDLPEGTKMLYSWSAHYEQNGSRLQLSPIWENVINDGGKLSFNFQMEYNGSNFNPVVVSAKGSKT